MSPDWKAQIIRLTEAPEARAEKIDASFFPALTPETLNTWESEHAVIPETIRSFLLQSDGLEAARGGLWPVLPLAQWEYIDDLCISGHPWIRFGETKDWRYLISLGHSPSIYRHEKAGSDEEFFTTGFSEYLEKVFRGQA